MAKLKKRPDGGYFTVVKRHGQMSTLQIHPEGGNYLLEHDVWPGMEIPDAYWRRLEERGWLSTKGKQGPSDVDEEVNDAEEFDDLQEESDGVKWIPDQGIIDVAPVGVVQAHADRPVFQFDHDANLHYIVLHLNGGNGFTEPTVMCIKFRVAQRLKGHGALLGRELPGGAFERLFLERGYYPNPGWKPSESRPLPLHQASTAPRERAFSTPAQPVPRVPLRQESMRAQQESGSLVGASLLIIVVLGLLIFALFTFF